MKAENTQLKKTITKNNMQYAFLKTFQNPIQPTIIPDTNILEDSNTKTQNNISKQYDTVKKMDFNDIQQSIKDTTIIESNSTNKTQRNKLMVKNSLKKSLNDLQLFSKTQNILQYLAELSVFDSQTLQKGIKIDLSSDSSKFFELHIGTELHLAIAYVYILDERTFAKRDSPYLHFIRCEVIQTTSHELIKVCVPTKNAFDYRVRSSGVDTRLFYEHPLRVCPLCIAELCEILSIKHKRTIHTNQIKEEEILTLIFKNKLKNLVM